MNKECPRCMADNYPTNQKKSGPVYTVYEYVCYRCDWKYSKKFKEVLWEENALYKKRR